MTHFPTDWEPLGLCSINPLKFISRATGLSNLIEKPPDAPAAAAAPAAPAAAAPPQAAPVLGAEPAPKKTAKQPRQFGAAVIGTGAQATDASGGKTLLGR